MALFEKIRRRLKLILMPVVRLQNRLSRCEPKWKWLFPTYLLLAMANVRTKILATPHLMDGTLLNEHENLMNGTLTAPQQYRLLQYYTPELVHRILNIDIPYAYLLQRTFWTALTFLVFHIYLRKWFDSKVAAIGTLFLAATMHWTYFNHLQESEPLNIFIFLIGLYAIQRNAFWPLLIVLIVGAFNKLTVIYLPLFYFVCWYKAIDTRRLLLRTLVLFIPVVFVCGTIRLYFDTTPYMTSFFQLQHNVFAILELKRWTHFGVLLLYGVFWMTAFLSYREKPLFLRRASLIVPVYCLGHLLIARINETRLFLPLAPVIIPMGLFYLFREKE